MESTKITWFTLCRETNLVGLMGRVTGTKVINRCVGTLTLRAVLTGNLKLFNVCIKKKKA